MVQLLIIADDLTGAIDTGVQLAKQGIGTTVVPFMSANISDQFGLCKKEVLIFNTESRHIDPEGAADRVKRIVEEGMRAGIQRFYKKTDSTMRGNVGAELEAFLKASDQESILFVPAHPRLKRFTIQGIHYIGDTLLHETEFGNDPLEPIKSSHLPTLLNDQTNVPVILHEKDRSKQTNLSPGIQIPDCQSESDLETIGQFAIQHNVANFLSGSAALAEYLSQLHELRAFHVADESIPSPLLLINGSMNPISHRQIEYAETHGWKRIPLSSDLCSNSEQKLEDFRRRISSELQQFYAEQQDVILSTSDLDLPFKENSPDQQSFDKKSDLVANRTGQLVVDILADIPYQTIMVIGGDTSLGIMRALNCQIVEPWNELLPGVALSLIRIEAKTLHLITKPGGYGEDDTILKISNYIRKQKG